MHHSQVLSYINNLDYFSCLFFLTNSTYSLRFTYLKLIITITAINSTDKTLIKSIIFDTLSISLIYTMITQIIIITNNDTKLYIDPIIE